MLAIVYAISAALSFGFADFFTRKATQFERSLKVLFYMQLAGAPVALLLLVLGQHRPWQQALSPAGAMCVLIGLVLTLGSMLLFRAIALGPLMLVSPIASSSSAITAGLALVVGERPVPLQLTGLVITMVGVTMAAIPPGSRTIKATDLHVKHRAAWLLSGASAALGASTLYGIGFFLLRYVVPVLGEQLPVLIMRLTGLALLLALFVGRTSLAPRYAFSFVWLLPIGVLDTLANWFFSLGLAVGLTSVVSVITSLYGLVAVILGALVLRERISPLQQVGIAVTLVGVGLTSVFTM